MENQSHHFTDSNLRATSLQNHAFNLLNLMDRTDESRMALDRFKKEREALLKRQEEASGTKRLVSPRFSFSSKYVSRRSCSSPNEQECSEGNFRTYTSTPAVHPKVVGHIFDPNPRNKLSIYHPNSSSNNIDDRPCSWSSNGGKHKRKAQHSLLVTPEVSPSPPSKRIRHSVSDGYRGVHKGYHTSKVQKKSSETSSSRHHAMKMKAPISNCCRCNRVNKSERERADSFPPSIPTLDGFDLCYEDDDISVWSFDETHSPVNARNSLSFYVED